MQIFKQRILYNSFKLLSIWEMGSPSAIDLFVNDSGRFALTTTEINF